MSEEKLYAVKNDEGKYWDFYSSGFWKPDSIDCIATPIKNQAELVIKYYGGHIVTFIEEPKKVALTKEQAKIVYNAHCFYRPATFISNGSCSDDEEELMMNAYVKGYTVEKEKKYNVKVPHTKDVWYYKSWNGNLMTICQLDKRLQVTFTEEDIEKYGLQDCDKKEVTDDGEED